MQGEADLVEAFGPYWWITKESLIERVTEWTQAPILPCADSWEPAGIQSESGDELWRFRTPPETWANLHGRAGYCLIRDGKRIGVCITTLN